MTDTDSGQSSQTTGGDPRDREIARLKTELIRTKERLLVALDATAGAEAETAEAKGKALEFLRELQARDTAIHKMNALMPELQYQADVAHKGLDELQSSRSYKLLMIALAPYRKVRSIVGL